MGLYVECGSGCWWVVVQRIFRGLLKLYMGFFIAWWGGITACLYKISSGLMYALVV